MSKAQISNQSTVKSRVISNAQRYPKINHTGKTGFSPVKRLSHRNLTNTSQMKDRNILDGDVKKKILSFLKDKKIPQKTLAIAKACNFSTSKEINPTIYQLQRQGTVVKWDLSPPTWKLSPSSSELESIQTTKICCHPPENKTANPRNKKLSATITAEVSTNSKIRSVNTKARQKQSHYNLNQQSMDDSKRRSDALLDKPASAPGAYVPKDPRKEEMYQYLQYQSRQHWQMNYVHQQHGRRGGWGGFNRLRGKGIGRGSRKGGGFPHQPTKHSKRNSHQQNYQHSRQTMGKRNGPVAPVILDNQNVVGLDRFNSDDLILDTSGSLEVGVTSPSSSLLASQSVNVKIEDNCENQGSGSNNFYHDSSDQRSEDDEEDDDYDSDEIQTRIQDMIFTSRAIESVNAFVDEDDDEEDSDEEEEEEEEMWEEGLPDDAGMKLEKEEMIEMWEEGLPDDSSSQVSTINLESFTVDNILEILMSVPMGTTSKSFLIGQLGISESEFKSCLAHCEEKGLVAQTDIGFVKITADGMAHLRLPGTSPPADWSSSNARSAMDRKVTNGGVEEEGVEDVGGLFSSKMGSSGIRSLGRGFFNTSNGSNEFSHPGYISGPSSVGSDVKSGGPTPSPHTLLQKNSLFQNTGVGSGIGRGQLLQRIRNSVRPGEMDREPISSQDDTVPSSGQNVGNYRTHLQQPGSAFSVVSLETKKVNSGLESLMPWRTSNSSSLLSLSSSKLSESSPSGSQNLSVHLNSSSSSSSQPTPILTQKISMSTQHVRPKPLLETPLQRQQIHQQQEFLMSSSSNVQLTTDRRPPLLGTPTSSAFSSPCVNGPTPSITNSSLSVKQPLLPDPGSSNVITQSTFVPVIPVTNAASLQINSESFAALNKNPISAFMEYAQSRKLSSELKVVNAKGPAHKPQFFVSAFLGGRCLSTVNCHNKKDGRKSAAEQALRVLHNEGLFHLNEDVSVMRMSESDMTHFDKIAALTHQKFNQLIASIPESFTGRKVIAGMVIKMGPNDVGSVIAIGSGNRCITGDKLSLEGKTVNDCHAEIITRRGFMRFLYYQLSTYKEGQDHPIFEKSSTGKLKVKDDVTFHLYISTAPCGDGALFSPRDVVSNCGAMTDTDGVHNPTFTTQVHGVLRTKMEGGEGTIPINPAETVQTWDGIVRGERLRTMSCSDKICRWNVLGLQGALLSHFVDTIYLSSLTLGFLFDHGHLSRAVCCRLNRGDTSFQEELPSGYHLNHPALGRVTACDPPRETQKTKSYSINWSACDERPELLDGTLGHCHTGIEKRFESRITKHHMYQSFNSLCHHLGRRDLLKCSSYLHAKQTSKDFTVAKKILMNQFIQSKCGKWVSKPMEEEMFSQ